MGKLKGTLCRRGDHKRLGQQGRRSAPAAAGPARAEEAPAERKDSGALVASVRRTPASGRAGPDRGGDDDRSVATTRSSERTGRRRADG